jgi:glycosyltransferase involved in cell wall biosynthesis
MLGFNAYKWLFANYLRKNVDRFFAICEGSRKWLVKNFEVPYESIRIIPLGTDKRLFAPSLIQRRTMRTKLGFNNDERVLVFVGRIIKEKDLHVLIRAISYVVSKSPNKVRLLLVGNGPENYLNCLVSLAEKVKVRHLITVVPPVSRTALSSYYNASDIAVWPGGPAISMIDAMATGLPLVVCKYHKLREDSRDTTHLIEYNNGLSFIRGNALELASCIEKLSIKDSLRRKMGDRSRELVEDKLNWETIASQYLTAYQEL